MPWSIFDYNNGHLLAEAWAVDLLRQLGAPITPSTVGAVYSWEVREGGGGKFNPLNQGPVPNHPELTTTGSQYGGGAADFASWQAGLQGAVDYLGMGNYSAIAAQLRAGDGPGALAALIASPWAKSRYGGHIVSQPLPTTNFTALPAITGASLAPTGQFPVSPDQQGSAVPVDGSGTGSSGTPAQTVSWSSWGSDTLSILGDIGGAVGGAEKTYTAIARVAALALNPWTWLRIFEVNIGVVMASAGVALYAVVLAGEHPQLVSTIASLIPGEGQVARVAVGATQAARTGRASATVGGAVRAARSPSRAPLRSPSTAGAGRDVRSAGRQAAGTASRARGQTITARTREPDDDDRRAGQAARERRSNRAYYKRTMDTTDLRRRTP